MPNNFLQILWQCVEADLGLSDRSPSPPLIHSPNIYQFVPRQDRASVLEWEELGVCDQWNFYPEHPGHCVICDKLLRLDHEPICKVEEANTYPFRVVVI